MRAFIPRIAHRASSSNTVESQESVCGWKFSPRLFAVCNSQVSGWMGELCAWSNGVTVKNYSARILLVKLLHIVYVYVYVYVLCLNIKAHKSGLVLLPVPGTINLESAESLKNQLYPRNMEILGGDITARLVCVEQGGARCIISLERDGSCWRHPGLTNW